MSVAKFRGAKWKRWYIFIFCDGDDVLSIGSVDGAGVAFSVEAERGYFVSIEVDLLC